ncbi:hypothetical protein Q4Q97_01325 [Morganella morganii]
MSKIIMLQLIRVAATMTGACSLIYLTAGYESALNHEITAFSLPLLFWRVMLYSAAGGSGVTVSGRVSGWPARHAGYAALNA